jgi:hypothetical protein
VHLLRQADGGPAVGRLPDHLQLLALEDPAQALHKHRMIVGEQNAQRHVSHLQMMSGLLGLTARGDAS